jgi:hypothetical protein
MQNGSLIRFSRRRGPDVWEYRWRESCPGDKRKHRRILIGSLDTLRDESAALTAIVTPRREININDARLKAKPLTLPSSSSTTGNENSRQKMSGRPCNEDDLRRIPEKVDRAAVGSRLY